jgi:transglutaminase-like putative cysteine protease
VLSWGYEPWSREISVVAVNVVRGDSLIPVDVSAAHDLPAPQDAIYWNSRVRTLQLPRLRVNDGVEVRTRSRGYSYALLGDGAAAGPGGAAPGAAGAGAQGESDDGRFVPPMPGEYFDVVLFGASEPVMEKRYVLSLPADKRLHSQIYNGPLYSSTTYSADSTRYDWWTADVPAMEGEIRGPEASDRAPKVVVATVESWEAKSAWFFDVNEGQFEVTPEVQAKVDEIFREAGLTNASEEKKAAALVHWVAQNIRYSGQTMGEGEGFTLHPGAMIFEQRSGVCKDLAGMLITMMRAAGMDSYGAMTMAGSRIEQVPADQFNHCVCALRKDDGSFEMYDPTWVPYMNDIWSKYETEQQYLIGDSDGEPLRTIDYSPPGESTLRVRHEASIAEDGTLTGTLTLNGSCALDSRLRNLVTMSRIEDVGGDIAELLSYVSDRVEAVSYDHIAPADFSRDAWVKISYTVPGFALPVDGGLEFESPMMAVTLGDRWLFRAGRDDWADERESDVFLYFTQLIDGEETIRLPKGYSLDGDAPASDEVDETYAYFKGSCEADGRDLTVTQHVEVRRRQIPPDGYEGFKRAIDEAYEWGGQVYRAVKGGGR